MKIFALINLIIQKKMGVPCFLLDFNLILVFGILNIVSLLQKINQLDVNLICKINQSPQQDSYKEPILSHPLMLKAQLEFGIIKKVL